MPDNVDEKTSSAPAGPIAGQISKKLPPYSNRPMTHKLPATATDSNPNCDVILLFFIRAMNEKFEFHFMGTELDQFGVRFGDLIFVKHMRKQPRVKSYLYLQAIHNFTRNPTRKLKALRQLISSNITWAVSV